MNITPNGKTFVLKETNHNEVLLAALSLTNKRSCGFDELSTSIIKPVIHLLLEPLTHIFNLSFGTGIVPQKLKIAKICPIYKSGDKALPVNYRPISLLPIFSKILEKLMHERIMSFINKYNLLSDCQYGFRSKRSCEDAVYNLSNFISEKLDTGIDVAGLFIDISKAFDSLSHKILLDKLYHYGFRGVIFDWLSSYLHNRFQYVSCNGNDSVLRLITTGIPQGSILGPILFLIYINDLPNITSNARFVLFADDTTSLIPCPRNIDITHNIDMICSKISVWFCTNRLVLNLMKCKCIYFSLREININDLPTVHLDGCNIEIVPSVKFLGCYVDNKLNWHDHIDNVCKKISKCIAMLRCVYSFPISIKRLIYFSFFHPFITYCLPAWGGTHVTYLARIVLLQKKAIRLISNSDYLSHTAPLARLTNILLFEDVYFVKVAKLMHSIYYKFDYYKFNLTTNIFKHDAHDINLRNVYNLPTLFCRTACRKRSVFFCCIKVWNSIDVSLKSDPNNFSFVNNLKYQLFSLYS
jgi:hypothetical protein